MPRILALTLASVAVAALTALPAFAQGPGGPPAPTTAVLVNLTVKPDVDRAKLMQTMPDEIRDTVRAYLDGKIQQWFGRADGRGVVFILNCASEAEARAIMGALPLAKEGLANFDYTPLTPLTPMRLLLGPPPVKPAAW
ncbi:MAG: hypothetical protein OEW19_11410 [Acidobacteriota bacterium]|nr:hypothetical protein [Acidobacteriota bacterium]